MSNTLKKNNSLHDAKKKSIEHLRKWPKNSWFKTNVQKRERMGIT